MIKNDKFSIEFFYTKELIDTPKSTITVTGKMHIKKTLEHTTCVIKTDEKTSYISEANQHPKDTCDRRKGRFVAFVKAVNMVQDKKERVELWNLYLKSNIKKPFRVKNENNSNI